MCLKLNIVHLSSRRLVDQNMQKKSKQAIGTPRSNRQRPCDPPGTRFVGREGIRIPHTDEEKGDQGIVLAMFEV
jgi:hypothetical protein